MTPEGSSSGGNGGPPGSGRDTHKRDDAPRGVFRPRPGLWGIRFTCGCGRLHEETIGLVKRDAVSAYHARRADVKGGWCPRRERRSAAPLFKTYADDFKAWAKQHHRSWRKDETRLSRVLPVFGDCRLDTITTAHVERFLDSLTNVAPATRNRYRDLLSGMFKRAKRLGLMASNPVQGIPKAKEAGGRIVYLPPATKDRPAHEQEALYAALSDEYRPAFVFSINTGLRWSEQAALCWRDVNLLAGTLTVATSKNGDGRTVPMNAAVRSLLVDLSLKRQRPDEPDVPVFHLAYRTAARAFERAVKAAQATLRAAARDASLLEAYTWHCNRHTFASRLVMAGVDLLSVQKLGGWRTLAMVQRYAHLAPDHLRAAVERLTGVGGAVSAPAGVELGPNLDSAPSTASTPVV